MALGVWQIERLVFSEKYYSEIKQNTLHQSTYSISLNHT